VIFAIILCGFSVFCKETHQHRELLNFDLFTEFLYSLKSMFPLIYNVDKCSKEKERLFYVLVFVV